MSAKKNKKTAPSKAAKIKSNTQAAKPQEIKADKTKTKKEKPAASRKKFTLFGDWLYNNKVLMAFSVILSVTLWVILTLNVTDRTEKVYSDIPINIYDSSLYESVGIRAIEIVGPESMLDGKVDIIATGSLYDLSQLTSDNLEVRASWTGTISEPSTYQLTLSVTCNNSDVSVDLAFADGTNYILERFDRYIEESSPMDVAVTTVGASAAENLLVGEAFSGVKTISVKGPETEVKKIAKVVLEANVNKTLSAAESFPGTIYFKDAAGNNLSETDRSKITIVGYSDGTQDFEGAPTQDQLKVEVPVEKEVTLPLEIGFKNAPTGFNPQKLKYVINPASITIKGRPDAIESEAQSGKFRPESQIDLSAVTLLNPMQRLKLSFSSGISVEGDVGEAQVTFDLRGYSTKILTLNNGIAHFKLINPDGIKASVVSSKIENVTIIGPAAAVAAINESNCIVEIDLSSVDSAAGQKDVRAMISFNSNDNCWATGTYKVTVQVG